MIFYVLFYVEFGSGKEREPYMKPSVISCVPQYVLLSNKMCE